MHDQHHGNRTQTPWSWGQRVNYLATPAPFTKSPTFYKVLGTQEYTWGKGIIKRKAMAIQIMTPLIALCVCEREGVCVIKRVCVRERVCAWEERVCACEKKGAREREVVCVRERGCMCEWEDECVWVRGCVCLYILWERRWEYSDSDWFVSCTLLISSLH